MKKKMQPALYNDPLNPLLLLKKALRFSLFHALSFLLLTSKKFNKLNLIDLLAPSNMNNLMTTTASLEAAFYHYPTTEDPIKGSFEPFGYFDTQDQSPARRGAPSALAETNNTYAQGSMSRTGSAYTPNPVTSKFPVYFNPFRGNVGLVCGREVCCCIPFYHSPLLFSITETAYAGWKSVSLFY